MLELKQNQPTPQNLEIGGEAPGEWVLKYQESRRERRKKKRNKIK